MEDRETSRERAPLNPSEAIIEILRIRNASLAPDQQLSAVVMTDCAEFILSPDQDVPVSPGVEAACHELLFAYYGSLNLSEDASAATLSYTFEEQVMLSNVFGRLKNGQPQTLQAVIQKFSSGNHSHQEQVTLLASFISGLNKLLTRITLPPNQNSESR